MSLRLHALVSRWVVPVALLTLVPVAAGPAAATGRGSATRLVVHAAPATVHVGAPLVVSGSVSPKAAAPLVLQRLVGTSWHTVAKTNQSADGGYSFTVKAPATAGKWTLRVTRVAKPGVKAGVSRTVQIRVVKALYVVTAAAAESTVTGGQPILVLGSVRPEATGSVLLQQLVGRSWTTLSSARLTGSTFRFATVASAGDYRLRVAKAFTGIVAGGVSAGLSVTVTPAPTLPTLPTVTATVLPAGAVGAAYTAQLTSAGGAAPYLWTSAGLPAGLTLTGSGTITGTPTTAGASTVTVAVTDGLGHTGTAALALTVAARPRPVGRLYAWGFNDHGQLGNDTIANSPSLVPVTGMTSVTAVSAGGLSGYALDADGSVWAWGDNTFGQLGDNGVVSSSVPVQVSGLTSVTTIAAGSETGYALRSDGTVWAWGNNNDGRLGNGSTAPTSNVPVQVSGLTSVTAIAGGNDSAYAVRSDGTVWSWGFNDYGQAAYNHTNVPVQVSGLSSVTAVAAGAEAGYALLSNGTVMSWGYGAYGERGDGTTSLSSSPPVLVSGLNSVTAIAAGGFTGFALRSNGLVWAWGLGNFQQVGNGTNTGINVPFQVPGPTGVTAISGGYFDGYAQTSDGHEWAWGAGTQDQLGNGGMVDGGPGTVSGLSGVVAIGGGESTFGGYAIATG